MTFLHERTTPAQEAVIFGRLPWGPFIKAALGDINGRLGAARIPLLLTLLCTLYLAGAAIDQQVANWVMSGLLGLGFLAVGLPHGALDHTIITPTGTKPWNLRFLTAYLGPWRSWAVCGW